MKRRQPSGSFDCIMAPLRFVVSLSILLALGFLLCASAPHGETGNRQARPAPAKVFLQALPEIKAKTKLPVLLPSELPEGTKDGEIHRVESKADDTRYAISLYFEPGVGDAGFAGYFAAERGAQHDTWEGKRVRLNGGTTGYFVERLCGGSCAPTNIYWEQDGVLYTIQWRLRAPSVREQERAMVRLANSAIRGGPR